MALLDEPVKQGFGLRYGRFVANHDQQQAALARELLDTVDAASYLPENVRVAEIDEAIDALTVAHHGLNNSYAEPSLAARLQSLVGTNGVPELVRDEYVTAITIVFLGRRSGVAWSADPIYLQLIQNFTTAEAAIALLAYDHIEISSKLQHQGPVAKYLKPLVLLEPKIVARNLRDLLGAIRAFTGPGESMRVDSALQRLAKAAR